MLQNAYFLAKIGADTAENERKFGEISQKLATTMRNAERELDTDPHAALALANLVTSACATGGLGARRLGL